ncbi:NPCBM/NEW2 domain-containing protein [Kribbella soli]|uniref:Glycosyl hydrolase family 98 putative carbohydrate-binding module domain-containing protein n=1 Tax=Kribbella soli TaxID=1124743 RepID=A0A4R0HAG3_9ACTN|nr:hypothetical protein E0H45_15795 [Kribbella soli]
MSINGKNHLHVVSMGRDGDTSDDAPGPCSREYNLGRKYRQMRGTVGVGDNSDSRFSCQVDIFVDGASRWSSGEVKLGKTKPLNVNVSAGLRVKIEMTFIGHGTGDCALGELFVST